MNGKLGSIQKQLRGCLAVALLLSVNMPAAQAADIDGVRLWRENDHTRIVFDLSDSIRFNTFSLDNPDRIVIDIQDSRLDTDFLGLDLSSSPIREIRSGIREGDDLRLVLDLHQAVEHNSFAMEAAADAPARLVLDLFDNRGAVAVSTVRTVQTGLAEERRDILVAVVAGHGGDDPGAPSYNRRFWEKDVTLAISRAIESRLEQLPGYRPVMIRDGDYSVELQSRPIIARDRRVDIYISIHADSYRHSTVQGVTIYALSGETADRENIRRVEEKENMAELLGGAAGVTSIANVEDDLALTLLDLSMAWSMEQSVTLGSHILDAMAGVAKLRKDKVQGGNLWELRSPDIPSILIETGYLSNPDEAERLASSSYQNRLADAVVQGVRNYFFERPPEGTLVAWQKQNGVVPESYTVMRGDSLSEIAVRFSVDVADLKAANGLRSDTIRIGQSLRIPGAYGIGQNSEHKISRGETLSEIAQRYQVSLANLRQINNISGDRILVGQVLKIPTS